jgi:enterochelin esterase family protein
MRDEKVPKSPRLEALRQALAASGAEALPAFWGEIEREGTPLIEALSGDATRYLVTFLYRDASVERRNVVVCSHALEWSFQRNQMTRLAGTDAWYHTSLLPAGALTSYWLSPDDSLVYLIDIEDRAERMATWRPDPLARRTFVFPRDEEDPDDKDYVCSMLETPGAPKAQWSVRRPEVPAGQVETHRFRSASLDNERRVWVYLPPDYHPAHEPYHTLVVFDGLAYLDVIPTPVILDNLLAARKLPPFVALFVDNVDRNHELPCHAPFADFLADELLEWARGRYSLTRDPKRTVVAGSSAGGLAAAYAGFRHPEVFGRVLSQSGAFWWRPEGAAEHEWLIHQFVASPHLTLQFYLDVGLFENGFKDPSMLIANRHLRDVLLAKNYPVAYAEYLGGHDYPWWEITLPHGLVELIGAEESGGEAAPSEV